MKQIMIRKLSRLIFMIMVFLTTGCIKETYDMNMLSKKVHLTPTMAISAIKGNVLLSDLVKSSDTVVYNQQKFGKIVFKKDSVIDFKLADVYDFNNMVSLSESYTVGNMDIAAFSRTMNFSLRQIVMSFSNPLLRTTFLGLNGSTVVFPSFPSTSLTETAFPSISNFEFAVFSSGTLRISVINNLPAPLTGLTIQLYNSVGHTPIGNQANISTIQPGATGFADINLANQTVRNSVISAITILGSPGTNPNPVLINLDGTGIVVGIAGSNLQVKSGRVILPANALGNSDTVNFDPGSGVELKEFKITTGNLSYHIQKPSTMTASLTFSLPTANRNSITPLTEVINLGIGSIRDGNIPFNNTIVDLGSLPSQPFNRMPYSISISSSGMVDFNSTDVIKVDLSFSNPVFDYVKGYFGQKVETIDPDSINLEIEDILSQITGGFHISNPSIKLDYWNSFGIPIKLKLNATGKRNAQTVNLGLDTVKIKYPKTLNVSDVDSSFAINKTNSKLPDLISLPPSEITFSGSAKMNPSVATDGKNNFVFGNSRFLGNLEIEVPMEFSMNLQFNDTLDNFLSDAFDTESDFNWDDFEFFRIKFDVNNGFPLGVSLKMDLLDSLSHKVISSIDATDLLKPAPVDAGGIATGTAFSSTSIEFTKEFFSSINEADKIIFKFKLNTTDNGTIKIYSDYRIDFNAALVLKPDININLK